MSKMSAPDTITLRDTERIVIWGKLLKNPTVRDKELIKKLEILSRQMSIRYYKPVPIDKL